jgi:hypothetical protein
MRVYNNNNNTNELGRNIRQGLISDPRVIILLSYIEVFCLPQVAEMLSLMTGLDGQGIPETLLRRKERLDVKDTSAMGAL